VNKRGKFLDKKAVALIFVSMVIVFCLMFIGGFFIGALVDLLRES